MAKESHSNESPIQSTSPFNSLRLLTEFNEGIAKQVKAIQAAGRGLLATATEGKDAGLREIRVEIVVGPDPNEKGPAFDSVDCWDQDVICGTSTAGYIHCTLHVCMEVGPVTLAR